MECPVVAKSKKETSICQYFLLMSWAFLQLTAALCHWAPLSACYGLQSWQGVPLPHSQVEQIIPWMTMPAICISHFWSSIFPVALVDCLWLSFITQGTVLDRIDYNVEQSCIKTEDGLKQLHKVMTYLSVGENLKNCFPISRIRTRLVFCLNCPWHFGLSSAWDGAVKMQPVVLFRAHHVGCGCLPALSESQCTPHAKLKLLRTPFCDSKLWKSWGFLPFRKYFIPWLGPLVLGNRLSGYLLKSVLRILSAGSCWLRPPLLW